MLKRLLFVAALLLGVAPAYAQEITPNLGCGSFNACSATATSGTSPETIANFMADYRTAQSFGAVGDGSTDNTAAFTAIFGVTSATEVYFPCGTYKIAGAISLSTSHPLALIGQNKSCVTVNFGAATQLAANAFSWVGGTFGEVAGITFDLGNMVAPAALKDFIAAGNAVTFNVHDIRIINAPALLLIVQAATNSPAFWIERNDIEMTAGATTQNQCINVSSTSGSGTTFGVINGNKCVNSGMLVDGSNISITNNDVSGYKFGGGIVVAADATYSFKINISGNSLHDSGTGADVNSTFPNGIESWASRSTISHNRLWNNASCGVSLGGQYVNVSGNIAWDNGTRTDAHPQAGFCTEATSATFNASHSYFGDNLSFDDGANTQQYGYFDTLAANTSDITFGLNRFSGTLGSMSILGTNYIYASSPDVVHPIAYATAVNMNSAVPTDTAMSAIGPTPSKYLIDSIRVRNCSATAAAAVAQIFTATGGGGTALTTSQTLTNSTTTANTSMALAAGIATTDVTASTWYFRLTTAQGTAVTCDVWLYGRAFQ